MKRLVTLSLMILLLVACGDSGVIGKPTDVRNDTTGNWKKATTSEDIDITEHAKEYADEHMEDGDTHFIINFTLDTTTVINKQGDMLFVDVHEYVDKEEHDASTIGSGMLLKEHTIDSDGKVEKVGD